MGTLYENVVSLCDQKGIKPGKMCSDLGISRGIITDLKMGRKKGLNAETADKIADYFDVSVRELISGESEQKEKPTPEGELDDVTKELQDIWSHADQSTREAILAAARMFKARGE